MADAQPGFDITQLVADHHEAVYRYAYRLTGSVQDAEDLTQHVFLVAQQKIGQLRKIEVAKSWLFRILRNAFLRQRQRRRPLLAADLTLRIDTVPGRPVQEENESDRLQEALNRLPHASRLVVTMFYFEGCSYKQIAKRLALPIGTVMSRLARARGHLRSMLFEPEEESSQREPRARIDL